MKYNYWLVVLFNVGLSIGQVNAQDRWQFSLLYSATERDTVQKSRAKTHNQPHYQGQPTQDRLLQLNGIIYIDDQHWSVWLNDQMIDINHAYRGIEIVQVTSGSMVFKVIKSNNSVLYRLHINQSIDLNAIIYAEHQHLGQIHN